MSHVTHANSDLTPKARERLACLVIEQGWTLRRAVEWFQCSPATAKKWVDRYRALGEEGMVDASSRPRRSPCRTPVRTQRRILALRFNRRGSTSDRGPPAPSSLSGRQGPGQVQDPAAGLSGPRDRPPRSQASIPAHGTFAAALGPQVKHRRTRPYQPQANGTIERFNEPFPPNVRTRPDATYQRPNAPLPTQTRCTLTITTAPIPTSEARPPSAAFTKSVRITPSDCWRGPRLQCRSL